MFNSPMLCVGVVDFKIKNGKTRIRTLALEITNHVLRPAELSEHTYDTYHIVFYNLSSIKYKYILYHTGDSCGMRHIFLDKSKFTGDTIISTDNVNHGFCVAKPYAAFQRTINILLRSIL